MRSIDSYISSRANHVDASGIRKVFDLAAKMKDPINLSIGLPDFDVPAPAKDAAIESIRAGHNRYTQTQGIARDDEVGDLPATVAKFADLRRPTADDELRTRTRLVLARQLRSGLEGMKLAQAGDQRFGVAVQRMQRPQPSQHQRCGPGGA